MSTDNRIKKDIQHFLDFELPKNKLKAACAGGYNQTFFETDFFHLDRQGEITGTPRYTKVAIQSNRYSKSKKYALLRRETDSGAELPNSTPTLAQVLVPETLEDGVEESKIAEALVKSMEGLKAGHVHTVYLNDDGSCRVEPKVQNEGAGEGSSSQAQDNKNSPGKKGMSARQKAKGKGF